jgi:hypothetical protein
MRIGIVKATDATFLSCYMLTFLTSARSLDRIIIHREGAYKVFFFSSTICGYLHQEVNKILYSMD